MKRTIPLLVMALSLGAWAQDPPSHRAPAVVKALGSRYKLPTPSARSSLRISSVRDVGDFVLLQQRHFPGAVLTSGFYDWRTTSKYRSQAGLHLGYDIAMPYGCPFSAGWSGTVVAITPWYGEETGITVVSPDGTSVTYGHVRAQVNIGQQVMPGDVLGTIASDHVDVKMRDGQGNYVDFGGKGRVVPAPDWIGGFYLPQMSHQAVMANWLLAQNGYDLAREEVRNEKLESEKRRLNLQALKQKVPALKESQRLMKEYVEQGLVSRLTAEENRQDLEDAQKELSRLSKLNTDTPKRLKQLEQSVKAAQQRLGQAKKMASERGITWKQVDAFVQSTIANNKTLTRSVQAYKSNAKNQNAKRLNEVAAELKKSDELLQTYEELFEMGGISRNELEEARLKNKILKAQHKALQGS